MGMSPRLLRPRASGGFSPKNIAGLVYWLDASQSSTVTVETGVAEWRDSAGSSIKASQVSANSQPAYQTAVQSGKNAVYFDGANDSITMGDLSSFFPSAVTALFAYKASNSTEYSLYTDNNNSAFWAYPTNRTYIGTFKSTRLNNVSSPLMPTNSAAVVAIASSSAAYRVYVDDVLAHDVAADFLVGTNHRIGLNDLGAAFKGWLYEVILYSSVLSDADLSSAYKYLKAKWGL